MVNTQETKLFQTEERESLDKLVLLKVEYDRAIYLQEKKGLDINTKKAYDAYIAHIDDMKKEPSKTMLRNYIDQVIKLDSSYLKKTYQYYSYIDKSLFFDRSNIISNLDYYKIVKHYLFEMNAEMLPDLENVSIVRLKKWKVPARSEIKTR